MPDVARAAGVSVMTVSYTYNRPDRVAPATREKVLAAAARLGYAGPDAAARNLRRGRAGSLGVVLGAAVGGRRLPVVDTWTSRRPCTRRRRPPRPVPCLPPARPQAVRRLPRIGTVPTRPFG